MSYYQINLLFFLFFLCNSLLHAGSQELYFNATLNNGGLNIVTLIPNRVYSYAGIKINTPGYSLKYIGTECTALSNGYCLFSANDTTPVFLTVTGPSGSLSITLCLNVSGQNGLSCQQYHHLSVPPLPEVAYIIDSIDNKVSVCQLTVDALNISHCQDTGLNAIEYPLFSYPQGITLNHAGTHAYITTFSDINAWDCRVNPVNHTFESCQPYTITSSPALLGYGMVALNTQGTVAYLVDHFEDDVLACPLGEDGAFSSTMCMSTGATTLDHPIGITLNKANTLAYIANAQRGISVCSLHGNDFINCVNKTGSSDVTFLQTSGAALNSDETMLYVASNYDPNVYVCSTQESSSSSFSFCKVANGPNVFTGSYGIKLNEAGNIAYITDGSDETYICPIKADATFDTCTTSNFVQFPTGIALR